LEKVQEGMNREKENDAKVQAMLKDCAHSLAFNAAAAQAVKDLGFGRNKVPVSVFASSPDDEDQISNEEETKKEAGSDNDLVSTPSSAHSASDSFFASLFGKHETQDLDNSGGSDGGGGGSLALSKKRINAMFNPFGSRGGSLSVGFSNEISDDETPIDLVGNDKTQDYGNSGGSGGGDDGNVPPIEPTNAMLSSLSSSRDRGRARSVSFSSEILDEDEALNDLLVCNDKTQDYGNSGGSGGGDDGNVPPIEPANAMFSPFGSSRDKGRANSISLRSADQEVVGITPSSIVTSTDHSPAAAEDLDLAQRDSSSEPEKGEPAPTIASVLVAAGITNWRAHAEDLVLNGFGVEALYQATSRGSLMPVDLGMAKHELKKLQKYTEKNPLESKLHTQNI